MPPYYCDYCDTTLTHDSPSVRKQHNAGYKHKANVRDYYQQFEEKQTQSLIDQRIKEHLGQAAAFLLGAPFNGQHLLQFPANVPGYHGAPTPNMRPQTRSGAPGYPRSQQRSTSGHLSNEPTTNTMCRPTFWCPTSGSGCCSTGCVLCTALFFGHLWWKKHMKCYAAVV